MSTSPLRRYGAMVELKAWGEVDSIVNGQAGTIQDRMDLLEKILSSRRRQLDVLRNAVHGAITNVPPPPGVRW